MKNLFIAGMLALFLSACAKSGQGTSVQSQSGTATSTSSADEFQNHDDSRVGPNATASTPVSPRAPYDQAINSSVTPSVPAPNQADTNSPASAEPNSVRNQVKAEKQARK